MNHLTKHAIAAAFAVAGTVATAAASSAMPLTPLAAPALVEHVAWGCGPGWHPNHWGRCVPNRVVVYPRYYRWHGPAVWIGHPHRHWHRWHHW